MTARPISAGLQLLAGGLLSLTAGADVIDTGSQEPWERCAYCHGIDGISGNARFPHLAGQRQDYLSKQLRDFRDGRRTNEDGVMATQADGLDRNTISLLAKYFSQQSQPAPTESDPGEEGKRLYHWGASDQGVPACVDCHGEDQQAIPRLAGQHPAYLTKQLNDFAADRRTNAPAGTMGDIARKLTEQQRQKLAAYIAGLEGGSH